MAKCVTAILVFLSMGVALSSADLMDYCKELTADDVKSNPKGMVFPSIPKSFDMTAEVQYLNSKKSLVYTYHFDAANKRAAETYKSPGENSSHTYLYDYRNNFYYSSYDGKCKNGNYTIDPADYKLTVFSIIPAQDGFFPAGDYLGMPNDTFKKYVEETTVRGVPVDHWTSCLWVTKSPYYNYKIKAEYYFSKGWQNPTVPGNLKRLVFKGVAQATNAKSATDINEIHDITEYSDKIRDPSVFEVPPGQYCSGPTQMRHPPMFFPSFMVAYEVTDLEQRRITNGHLYWDATDNLSRIDTRFPDPKARSSYGYGMASSEIRDYNTGVKYRIEKATKKCTASPLTEHEQFMGAHGEVTKVFETMADLERFFEKTNFQYNGMRTVDGVLCDVYVSNTTMPGAIQEFIFSKLPWITVSDRDSFMHMDVIYKVITYKGDPWVFITDEANQAISRMSVIYKVITYVGGAPRASMKFYDYNSLLHPTTVFDIQACRNDAFLLDLQIEFNNQKKYSYYTPKRNIFRWYVRRAIGKTIGISQVRLVNEVVSIAGSNKYYYNFRLLGKADDLLKFHPHEKDVPAVDVPHTVHDITSAADCATQCMTTNMTLFNCSSFDFCASSKTCKMSSDLTVHGPPSPLHGLCAQYTKNVENPLREKSLFQAYAALHIAILEGILTVEINASPVDSYTLVAVKMIHTGFEKTNSSLSQEMQKEFDVKRRTVIPGFNHAKMILTTPEDCARRCLNTMKFTCESFEYCYLEKSCYLSKAHPGDSGVFTHTDSKYSQRYCDLYSRKYMSKYSKNWGLTVMDNSIHTYQMIRTPEYCAQMCSKTSAFTCLSFQYCAKDRRCVLRTQHKENVVRTLNASHSCVHYYRNYVSDFTYYKNKVVLKPADLLREVEVQDTRDCSKICVDEGDQCLGYDICKGVGSRGGLGGKMMCRLTSKNLWTQKVQTLNSPRCHHMSRRLYKDGSPVTAASIKLRKRDKGGKFSGSTGKYSSGSMGGLALAMIIVGCLLCVATGYAYLTKTATKPFSFTGSMGGLAIAMIIVGCLLCVGAGYAYLKLKGRTLDSDFIVKLSKLQEE